MLEVRTWPVPVVVPVDWPPGPGCRWPMWYLEFLGGRCRPNTVLAAASDLRAFFTVVGKPPEQVQPADVLAFITAQRTGPGSSTSPGGELDRTPGLVIGRIQQGLPAQRGDTARPGGSRRRGGPRVRLNPGGAKWPTDTIRKGDSDDHT